jgi:hypothetical protein
MSRVTRDYPRQADEEYNTPAWVAGVIALWLKDQGVRSIWDPARGSGQFAASLRSHGFRVDASVGNFLDTTGLAICEALVTNPPYGKRGELADAFIRHALELKPPIAAFLLRVDADSAKTRSDIFRDCPTFAGKIVLLDRIVWFEREGAAGPSENHAWFIWDRSHQARRPWIAYGRKGPCDENRPREVDHADQGRGRDRRAYRRHAPSERSPRGG